MAINKTQREVFFLIDQGAMPFIAFFMLLALANLIISQCFSPNWWNGWEPLLAIGTLGVAVLIWLQEAQRAYLEQLPKRLTVGFIYIGNKRLDLKNKEVMRCERAFLAGEADIRNWGQQLGMQMSGSKLEFTPDIEMGPAPTPTEVDGESILEFNVRFFLTALPNRVLDAPPNSIPLTCRPKQASSSNSESTPANHNDNLRLPFRRPLHSGFPCRRRTLARRRRRQRDGGGADRRSA